MKFHKTLFAFAVLLAACSEDNDQHPSSPTWTKLGLDGKTINEMQLSGSSLYVATTTGLFKRDLDAEANDFLPIGFNNKNVEALLVLGQNKIIVSLFEKDGSETPALYKSNNGGESWTSLDSNFGGEASEPIFDLAVRSDDENILYATGYSVVAKSADQGETWEPIYGDWGGFATGISVVEINPNETEEIWAGGQGAIENGFLIRSENESDWETWSDLAENPSVVKEITFKQGNRENVLVGFEGVLVNSMDGGDSWQTLIDSDDNRFYFGICRSQDNPQTVYAGGWLKTPDPQPLKLFVSRNDGQSWEEFQFQGETYGGILEMQIKNEDDKDVIFLGLDKGGVYQITTPLL